MEPARNVQVDKTATFGDRLLPRIIKHSVQNPISKIFFLPNVSNKKPQKNPADTIPKRNTRITKYRYR